MATKKKAAPKSETAPKKEATKPDLRKIAESLNPGFELTDQQVITSIRNFDESLLK